MLVVTAAFTVAATIATVVVRVAPLSIGPSNWCVIRTSPCTGCEYLACRSAMLTVGTQGTRLNPAALVARKDHSALGQDSCLAALHAGRNTYKHRVGLRPCACTSIATQIQAC